MKKILDKVKTKVLEGINLLKVQGYAAYIALKEKEKSGK